ncbi:hypothetical protein OSB04_015813 [Centaurea solstitialis]|uniref:F-box domain-containing protein n=1 Tax=Centaurea solstitialis TaxID=347529 RepID=A0AA38TJQ0_9ASTR|nr:hypothetical protein OSB04_015813 [Centaurea solstitialis]
MMVHQQTTEEIDIFISEKIKPNFVWFRTLIDPLWKDLPEELMIDILSRLTVKTVIHCKLVCKKWRDLILDSSFVNLHLSKSPTVPIPGHHVIPLLLLFLTVRQPKVLMVAAMNDGQWTVVVEAIEEIIVVEVEEANGGGVVVEVVILVEEVVEVANGVGVGVGGDRWCGGGCRGDRWCSWPTVVVEVAMFGEEVVVQEMVEVVCGGYR